MDRETLAASVAGMAARLRIQLSNLTAASQMLERTATGENGAYLAVLNQSICRMLRSVGQMELLDRLTDEDEIRAFPAPVDLGPWSAQLAARARGVLGGAGVSLSYQGPERLLAHVDQDLAEQMVLSLVACAARPGGEVSITLTQQEDSACFTVRGPGPARPGEELIQRLSAPRPGGTGRGLGAAPGPADCRAARGQPGGAAGARGAAVPGGLAAAGTGPSHRSAGEPRPGL